LPESRDQVEPDHELVVLKGARAKVPASGVFQPPAEVGAKLDLSVRRDDALVGLAAERCHLLLNLRTSLPVDDPSRAAPAGKEDIRLARPTALEATDPTPDAPKHRARRRAEEIRATVMS